MFVSLNAGMELLCPSTCGIHHSWLLHTHPAGKRCLKGKCSALVVQESEKKHPWKVSPIVEFPSSYPDIISPLFSQSCPTKSH